MFSSVPQLPFQSSNERVIGEKKCSQQTMEGFQTSLLLVFSSRGGAPRCIPHRGQRCHCAGRQKPSPPEGHAPITSPRWLCTQVSSVCPVGGERVSGQRDREHLSAGGELDKELPVSCGECVPALSPITQNSPER